MTDKELDEIEARCRAATEGPWRRYEASGDIESVGSVPKLIARGTWPHDGAFIVHARTDVSALVAEVKSLREQVAAAVRLVKRQADREASGMGDI